VYWLRAYQTYVQMGEFDRYFSITSGNDFTLHFKEPIMYSSDFVSLAKLYASSDMPTPTGRRWRYNFRKIDDKGNLIKPEIKFYSDLTFNKDNRLTDWTFSPLFLQIAPAKLLEMSLRSLGGGEIDEDKQQLRASTINLEKINTALPKKAAVVAQLGEPLSITQEAEQEIYTYHFLLETYHIEEGYEDHALNEIKLHFDKKSQELVRMATKFAGLKIAINYQKWLKD
jgi:hypothetical protein